jgi:hypothetical protein
VQLPLAMLGHLHEKQWYYLVVAGCGGWLQAADQHHVQAVNCSLWTGKFDENFPARLPRYALV